MCFLASMTFVRNRQLFHQDKTRQDKNSTESRSLQSQSTTTKKYPSLLESKHLSERDGTLQCGAGPESYGCHGTIGTLASTWAPAIGRPSESAGCLAARKKKLGRSSGKKHADRILNVVCTFQLCTPNSRSYAPLRSVPLVAHEYATIILHLD